MWFLKHIKIRKNPKDEPSIDKIERVTAVFVSQVVAKSQIQQIFKSQNLTAFLRFRPIFFSCEVNLYFWKHIQSFKVKQQLRALKLNCWSVDLSVDIQGVQKMCIVRFCTVFLIKNWDQLINFECRSNFELYYG